MKYMQLLQNFIDTGKYDTLLDFGCGDWQFMRHMDLERISYHGYEVVEKIYEQARQENSKLGVTFHNSDFSDPDVVFEILHAHQSERLLITVKDVFQHWDDEDVRNFLDEVYNGPVRKGSTLLVTNNWRYIRKPQPLPNPRDLDRYHWCPIDFTQPQWARYDLYPIEFYPRKEKMVCRHDWSHGAG